MKWSLDESGADRQRALCQVKVPAGEHEVALRYETPSLRIGMVLSTLGWLVLILWMALRIRQRRRRAGLVDS